MRFPVDGGSNTVVIKLKNDFGLSLSSGLPPLGSTSRGLRVLSESWDSTRTQLTLKFPAWRMRNTKSQPGILHR
jgi:hypothetical protein